MLSFLMSSASSVEDKELKIEFGTEQYSITWKCFPCVKKKKKKLSQATFLYIQFDN